MEHNEYSVHTVKVRYKRRFDHYDSFGDRCGNHVETVEETLRLAAPNRGHSLQHIGLLLVGVYLDEKYRHGEPLESGAKYEILEQREEALDGIIRISMAYRSQM